MAKGKFHLYSTEVTPTTNPQGESPAPLTLIQWDRDPSLGNLGEYSEAEGDTQRGSNHKTLGGTVYQDFGTFESDQSISMSDDSSMSQVVKAALQTAYETKDGQFYFTDGYKVWKVRFLKPGGFKKRRNLSFAYFGKTLYSYEINFLVVTEEV